jgi:hypothetical protein
VSVLASSSSINHSFVLPIFVGSDWRRTLIAAAVTIAVSTVYYRSYNLNYSFNWHYSAAPAFSAKEMTAVPAQSTSPDSESHLFPQRKALLFGQCYANLLNSGHCRRKRLQPIL